jgi:hypothetical protein
MLFSKHKPMYQQQHPSLFVFLPHDDPELGFFLQFNALDTVFVDSP